MPDKLTTRFYEAMQNGTEKEIGELLAQAKAEFNALSLQERYKLLLDVHETHFGGEKDTIAKDIKLLTKTDDLQTNYDFLAETLSAQLNVPADEICIATEVTAYSLEQLSQAVSELNARMTAHSLDTDQRLKKLEPPSLHKMLESFCTAIQEDDYDTLSGLIDEIDRFYSDRTVESRYADMLKAAEVLMDLSVAGVNSLSRSKNTEDKLHDLLHMIQDKLIEHDISEAPFERLIEYAGSLEDNSAFTLEAVVITLTLKVIQKDFPNHEWQERDPYGRPPALDHFENQPEPTHTFAYRIQ